MESYQKFQFLENNDKLTDVEAQLVSVKIEAKWWILWWKPHENIKGNIFIAYIFTKYFTKEKKIEV